MRRRRIPVAASVVTVIVAVALLCAAAAFGGFTGADALRGDPSAPPTPSVSAVLPSPLAAATLAPSTRALTQAPAPTPAGVQAALAGPLTAAALGTRVRASVLDAETGTELLARDSDSGSVPASTAKLATAAAVLTVLSPDATLATRILTGTAPGEIVLVGGGDPTLSAAPAGQASTYPGAARISALADALRATGTAVTAIVVDSSLFTGPVTGPGWDPDDVPTYYAAPITATMVDGGRAAPADYVRSAAPDIAAGRALAAALGVPSVPVRAGLAPPAAGELARTTSAPVRDLVQVMLKESDNVIAEMLARQVALATGQPASFAGAAAAVVATIAKLGVTSGLSLVDGSGLSPSNAVTPAALAALLHVMVKAATEGSAAAMPVEPSSTAPAPTVSTTAVTTAATTGTTVGTTTGTAGGTTAGGTSGGTPPARRAIASVLADLPVAGWDGTLAQRFTDGDALPAVGVARAKTGTLTGVSAMAGIVRDADGRVLIFVILADRVAPAYEATLAAQDALDDVIGTLARCGCR